LGFLVNFDLVRVNGCIIN